MKGGRTSRRIRRFPRWLWSRTRIKAKTARLLLSRSRGTSPGATSPSPSISVLMSFRITSPERAAILQTVLQQLKRSLEGPGMTLWASDASDRPSVETETALRALPVEVIHRYERLPMASSYVGMLGECGTEFCYLQFDDQLTTNLSERFLRASCELLRRNRGRIDVVSIPWPEAVRVDHEKKEVVVVCYQRDGAGRYAMGAGPARPLWVEKIDGFSFGIFENFLYGFYFNHLIARTDDYARRLGWYMNRLGSTSVHEIEVAAASRELGPFWTHIAVCLDDIALVDLDHVHTEESMRPVRDGAREVYEAINAGYAIDATHVD